MESEWYDTNFNLSIQIKQFPHNTLYLLTPLTSHTNDTSHKNVFITEKCMKNSFDYDVNARQLDKTNCFNESHQEILARRGKTHAIKGHPV